MQVLNLKSVFVGGYLISRKMLTFFSFSSLVFFFFAGTYVERSRVIFSNMLKYTYNSKIPILSSTAVEK